MALALAGCENKAPEPAKPATTAPVFSPENLAQRTIERRAIEAVIWGMPAVNFDRMYQAMVHDANGDGSNKVVFWSRPLSWKNQALTPNPDTIYLMPFLNTKDVGPVVLEIPPADNGSITGSVDDSWQTAAGRRNEVDAIRHLIVTATGWGLNPDKDAIYLNITPTKNDGTTIYKLNVKGEPVDGFWSASVYNSRGYFVPNKLNGYTLNNVTANKGDDGSVTIQFGGCDGQIPNCIPITRGWNYMVRLYRPRPEILNGSWKFPAAEPQG